jgi:AAA+ ATPase superfamily predicted ATPase
MELQRILNLPNLLSRKSFFLFGPRATGKSTLIKQQFYPENRFFFLGPGQQENQP